VVAARTALLEQGQGHSPQDVSNVTQDGNIAGALFTWRIFVWYEGQSWTLDWQQLTTYDGTDEDLDMIGGPQPTDFDPHGSGAVGIRSAAIDSSAIVAALQDIALREEDYVANNGGTLFSMRGKTRVE
jgi:hypothetical protein